MTSTSRVSNSSSELQGAACASPYAAPQSATSRTALVGRAAKLAPYVPQDFRDAALRHTEPASVAPALADSHSVGEVVTESNAPYDSAELPWIEAFVADATSSAGDEHSDIASDDTWPMGEAARRLDELTESLTSIDASRALLNANEHPNGEHPTGETPASHAMWNDDEWMDIMPTSAVNTEQLIDPVVQPGMQKEIPEPWQPETEVDSEASIDSSFDVDAFAASEPTGEELAQPDIANLDFSGALSASFQHAETTARALEGLAQRVRAGEVPVPAVQPDLGDAAVLAGVLAALLGWRR